MSTVSGLMGSFVRECTYPPFSTLEFLRYLLIAERPYEEIRYLMPALN